MNNKTKLTKGIMLLASLAIAHNGFSAGVSHTQDGVSYTTIFYLLMGVGLFLIFAILFLGIAIQSLVRSDFFRKKIAEKELKDKLNKGGKLLGVLALALLPVAGFSASTGASGVAETSTITLEWVIAIACLDIALLGILMYLRRLFYQLLRTVKPKKQSEKATSKITQVLTDAVPLDREEEIMTDHEYDGIKELDNNLPPWWLWSFYISIVVAFIYMFNYHIFKTSDLQHEAYEKSVIEQDKQIAEYLKSMKLNVDEKTVTLLTDEGDLTVGKEIYTLKCTPCHGKRGEGIIGPNLTDKYWLKGGDVKSIFKTIKYGTNKGMQAWKDELNPIEIQQVTSFIKSIEGTVTDGKEPQGTLYQEETTVEADTTAVNGN